MNRSGQITVRVTKNDDEFLENLVEHGEYVTKGEAVRDAIREMRDRLSSKKGGVEA